jgi:hypothetical protein
MTPKQQAIYEYVKANPGCRKIDVVKAIAGWSRNNRFSNQYGYSAVNRMLKNGMLANLGNGWVTELYTARIGRLLG